MRIVNFATTNREKIQIAETVCAEADISVISVGLDVDEIQSEDPERIFMAPATGFEPVTFRLTAERSTAELRRIIFSHLPITLDSSDI